jgi:hypothetical protein
MMAELDYLSGSRLPGDLDPAASASRRERLEDVQYVAQALAGTASDIPQVLRELRMAQADKQRFRALAEELRVEALDLGARAARGELRRDALARIAGTCDACHEEFRIDLMHPERAQR